MGKTGAGTSPAEREFFCGNPRDLSATSQRPIFTKFGFEMHCRKILFTPRCSPRAREFPRSEQLFFLSLRRTVAELRGVKVAEVVIAE